MKVSKFGFNGLAIVAMAALLSGCWLQVGAGPKNQRYNPLEDQITAGNVTTLKRLWTRSLEHAEPMVLGDRVYLAGFKYKRARIWALDADTGETIWETAVSSDQSVPSVDPISVTPVVFTGSELWMSYAVEINDRQNDRQILESALVRVDYRDGSVIDREATDSIITTHVISTKDVAAYVQDNPRQLVVRSPETGSVLWTTDLPGLGENHVAIDSGQIYVADGPVLQAFNVLCSKSCSPIWSHGSMDDAVINNLAVGPHGEVITTTQVRDNPQGPLDFSRLQIQSSNGTHRWSTTLPSIRELAVDIDTVFVLTEGIQTENEWEGSDNMFAYPLHGCEDMHACEAEWQTNYPFFGRPGSLVIGGGVVYTSTGFADPDAVIFAFDADGCGEYFCPYITALERGGRPESIADGKLYATQNSLGVGIETVAWAPPKT